MKHWDNAREQGKIAGANMTGKKRIKFDYVPYFFSDLFDLNFEFVGDFSFRARPVKIEGDRKKKNFIARYYQGAKFAASSCATRHPTRRKPRGSRIRDSQK